MQKRIFIFLFLLFTFLSYSTFAEAALQFLPRYQGSIEHKYKDRTQDGGRDKVKLSCESFGGYAKQAGQSCSGMFSRGGLTCYKECFCDTSTYQYTTASHQGTGKLCASLSGVCNDKNGAHYANCTLNTCNNRNSTWIGENSKASYTSNNYSCTSQNTSGSDGTCYVCACPASWASGSCPANAASCSTCKAVSPYTTNKFNLVSCNAGYYKNGNSCTQCPAGYKCDGINKTQCPGGSYAAAGASTCSQCLAGQYSSAGASSCSSCAAGTYAAAGSTSCSECRAGTYSAAGASGCTSCSAGKYSAAGASYCNTCAAGTYSNAGASSCTKCRAGYYSGSGEDSCIACGVGTYSAVEGSSSCAYCKPGTYSSAGATSCTKCKAGTYASSEGFYMCRLCRAGTYSSIGASSCNSCPAGTFSGAGSSSCSACSGNTYSSAGAGSCTSCPSGYNVNPSHTGCEKEADPCDSVTAVSVPAHAYCSSYHSSCSSKCSDWDCYYPYRKSGNICEYDQEAVNWCIESDCSFEDNCDNTTEYCNKKYPLCEKCCRGELTEADYEKEGLSYGDHCYYFY